VLKLLLYPNIPPQFPPAVFLRLHMTYSISVVLMGQIRILIIPTFLSTICLSMNHLYTTTLGRQKPTSVTITSWRLETQNFHTRILYNSKCLCTLTGFSLRLDLIPNFPIRQIYQDSRSAVVLDGVMFSSKAIIGLGG